MRDYLRTTRRHHVPTRFLAAALAVIPAALNGCQVGNGPEVVAAPSPAVAQPAVADPPVAAPVPAAPVTPPSTTASGNDRTPLIVVRAPTSVPDAPPPIAQAPAMLALPDLPHPSRYPKQAKAANGDDTEECGVTWTGSEWVANECIDTNVRLGKDRMARVVVPYARMNPLALSLPRMVDHRADGTEGPIRHQVGAQCTAFAFTSALDHAYARWTGKPAFFSVMQVWARYHRSTELEAAEGNVGDSLANEVDWPYDAPLAGAWKKCGTDPAKRKPGKRCSELPDPARLASLEASSLAEITQVEEVGLDRLDLLREKLAGGEDVTVAIKLHSFATAGEPGAKYIIGEKDGAPNKGFKEHQILLAGYAMTANGTYYLVHNSWGTKWGDAGYAWIHEDVLRAHAAGGGMFVPDLQPKQVADLRLRADTGLTAMCAKGELPDSLSGVCAGRCPDKSPRHGNVCAAAPNPCAAGMVNLTGSCQMAAPSSAGVDATSGVSWECGAGGCTYGIPNGRLGCKTNECAVSCPAPTFRLATTQKGLACID